MQRPELPLEGADLDASLRFLRAIARPCPPWRALMFSVRHASEARRTLATVRRLPTIDVRVSDSPPGARIRSLADRYTFGVRRPRYAVSVLRTVPPADYLRGRSRQAVRTNCAQAAKVGVTCREVTDPAEQLAATHTVLTRRNELDNWQMLRKLIASQRDCMFVAEVDGSPLVLAFVTIDEAVAHLGWYLSVPDDARASPARYLLHVTILEALTDRRIGYLLGDAVVVVSEGLRYFHDRLGFVVTNLRYRPGRPGATPTSRPSATSSSIRS